VFGVAALMLALLGVDEVLSYSVSLHCARASFRFVMQIKLVAAQFLTANLFRRTAIRAACMDFLTSCQPRDIPLWNRNQGNVGAAKTEIERPERDVGFDPRRVAERVSS
jgi:hypothetical protein